MIYYNKRNNLSPEITVIIPFYGDKNDLANCIGGINQQNFNKPFEIIVVESGKDPELKKLMDSAQNSVLISCDTQMYPGKARNIGTAHSKSDLLAFIDADCIPAANWLSEIHASLKSGNKIVIGPVIDLYPFHPAASIDNLLQFPDFRKHRPYKNFTHFPDCNLGINKELVYKSGKFPEEIITGEDVIFSQSAIRNNEGKVYFNRNLIVRHSGRKSFKSFIEHNRSLGFHRGYLNLKISRVGNKNRDSFLFALIFGIKRLIYISVRTLQWNPAGLFSMIFYFPFVILGLSAWVEGFRRGNKKYLEEKIAV
jgi:glycosyltransferase involved in cell wall biosynthesis